jgi:hypothetical protein
MSIIIQYLCFQNLIDEKLRSEKNSLRNIVGHIALTKRLQLLLQAEGDTERLAPSEIRRQDFSERQGLEAEALEETNTYGLDSAMYGINEKCAGLRLNDSGDD